MRKNLKDARKRLGLTQKEMAELLRIDRTTYVKYESGSNEPPFSSLHKLAEYFDVSIDYLLERTEIRNTGETEKPTVSDDGLDEELVNLLVDLSPSEVQRVQDFVAGLKASRKDNASRQQ